MSDIEAIPWVAKAFQGRFLVPSSAQPYVSELSGKVTIEQSERSTTNQNLRLLAAVHVAIAGEVRMRRPVDPRASLKPFMTITFDRLVSGVHSGRAEVERIARFDLVTDGDIAYGCANVPGVGYRDVTPQPVVEHDCAWAMAARLIENLLNLVDAQSSRQCPN